jgi:hypothetical protein
VEELTFSNEASYRRYLRMADKIEADPALLDIPLDNIARWLARGHWAVHRLEQWRGIILRAREAPEGMTALLQLMRDNNEEAQHLKSFSPMAGILTREERDLLSCGYAH